MSRPKCKQCNDRGVIVRHVPYANLAPSASLCECILARLERLEQATARRPTIAELRERVALVRNGDTK